MSTPFDPPPDPAPASPAAPRPRGRAALAWIAILCVAAVQIALPSLLEEEEAAEDEGVGRVVTRLQGRYLVGAAEVLGGEMLYADAARQLNVGSVDQRQRFVVLAGELSGPATAAEVRAGLDTLIAEQREQREFELAPEQSRVQRILRTLYPAPSLDEVENGGPPADGGPAGADGRVVARVAELEADDRALLVERLGWFGELALAPPGIADASARRAVLASAQRTFFTLVGAFGAASVAGLAGFAGLVVVFALVVSGRLRGGLRPGRAHHGIYAETFALWMVLFLAAQILAAVVASAVAPRAHLLLVLVAFFASLGALAWPRVRGVSWRAMRDDVGLSGGRRGLLEVPIGLGAYAMSLPFVAVGIGVTLVLMLIQAASLEDRPPLEPVTGPAHPIILELADGSWWVFAQVLVLGAVAAPIVEETMFRGVLYRHLRDASAGAGTVASILVGTAVNTLLFAAIHPQGWVAVPLLMSLATGFTLAREWRGTLIPSIVMHGFSNGAVLCVLAVLLR